MEALAPEEQLLLQQEFWRTLELLVSREWKRTEKDVMDDVHDWVDKLVAKRDARDDENDSRDTGKSKKSDPSTSSGYGSGQEKETEQFFKRIRLPRIECKFSHPYVRSRLEKLMGSNMVSLTDRAYMQQLQERILADYANAMGKRIAAREAEEMERVKNLVLTGKIPLDQAPPEMANHPVRLIEIYCQKLIAERRAKIKVPKVIIPRHLYWDDIPDPPSGLSIERGHVFRRPTERLCHPPDCLLNATTEDDIENGYMFTDEEYIKLSYENPLIEQLRQCETVEEMYLLADEIIGVLKTLEGDEVSMVSAASAVP